MNLTNNPLAEPKDDLSSHGHRQLIGAIGLLMPLLLWLIAGLRPDGTPPWVLLSSISAYYYSGAVSVFAGMLVAMALFLFTYRGYANPYYFRDRTAACIAGLAALLIALFPTEAPSESHALAWWTPLTGAIHLSAALVMFGSFVFFALWQFPISSVQKGEPLPRGKQVRNAIFRLCGVAIVASNLWAVYAGLHGMPIFWPETFALEFFAASWLLKGRLDQTAVNAGRKTAYYVRHPQQLIKKISRAEQRQSGIHQLQ